MIYYKTQEEIEQIRKSCLLVAKTLAEVGKAVKPGITTLELDQIAETFIRDHHGVPAFKGYHGFPGSACVSVNEQVVHGIPGKRVLNEGDIVSVDIGAVIDGFYGDSAYTFPVGEISDELKQLLKVTKESLSRAIDVAVTGKRMGDIGYAVQDFVEREHQYHIVRDLVGHGVGKQLHESPEVPNFGRRGHGMLLKEGLVIAIEPMVNLGTRKVYQEKDGWTIVANDKLPSAHYEHTVAIKKDKADVLTTFEYIESAVGVLV